jgi:predicted Fe-Mo cluster-binding NifX family protein
MKILLTVHDNDIAPRFDQTTEVIIAEHDGRQLSADLRTIILSRRSAEDLIDLIIKEGIDCVVCGGIEENYYRFFAWKKIAVFDGIIGSHSDALQMALSGRLRPGEILQSTTNRC